MPANKLFSILLFIATTFFSQEAWVTRVHNKNLSVDELTDQASFIFKVEKVNEFEDVLVSEGNIRDVKLKYLKVKIIEVIKSNGSWFSNSELSVKSPPRSGLFPLNGQPPKVGQTISISDRAPLESKPPEGKSYYKYRLENQADDKAKTMLFFSSGYLEKLSVFWGVVGFGLVDLNQQALLNRSVDLRVYFDAVRSKKIDNLKAAIAKYPKEINSVDATWGTPLQFAARYGNKEDINLLIKQGADLLTPNSTGNGVLHDLVVSQFDQNLLYIIELSRAINLKNREGKTPIHLAVQGHAPVKIIKMLVLAGADSKIKDADGNTALDLAKTLNPSALAELNNASRGN